MLMDGRFKPKKDKKWNDNFEKFLNFKYKFYNIN